MWCLCSLLPIMIGDKVPESDLRWQNFLSLLTIMDLLLALKMSQDDIAVLIKIITLLFLRIIPLAVLPLHFITTRHGLAGNAWLMYIILGVGH